MALDFHRLDNGERLWAADDAHLAHLATVFDTYAQWTGITIDPYGHQKLTAENCSTLITIIARYIRDTDLNRDKAGTATIIEFGGLLKYWTQLGIELQLRGD